MVCTRWSITPSVVLYANFWKSALNKGLFLVMGGRFAKDFHNPIVGPRVPVPLELNALDEMQICDVV